ncbi:glutathione S-transferase [Rhodobacteraceae bacterium 2CG4]|uniref:Glutathione S-transferase n=1 Tax=Halovulum marinum TaxID=2662447 RepID=A0A6L5Z0Y6_9RHOB|nr:glutathione S-transferase family protein [Halovulum marinum]MSU89624.1 glutathione S-transferase [Halovulum marinum]
MLTLFHACHSRSTRIVQLIDELGARDRVEIRPVTIPRRDGSGAPDAANPHPEHKVPLLLHDGVPIRESNAIMQYLCELFPEAGLAPMPGQPGRGPFLSWMAWYGNVMEPVYVHSFAGLEHPLLQTTFRGLPEVEARLAEALRDRPYLLGERFSAADLLIGSTFAWMPEATPDVAQVKDWAARCTGRGAARRAAEYDARLAAG